MRKNIAFIIQRYGLEINGGAEYHCRMIAEHLNTIYNVTILTTCAKDYLTWENDYAEGISHINSVNVQRFTVAGRRNLKKFHALSRYLNKRMLHQKILKAFGLLAAFERMLPNDENKKKEERLIDLQGPYVPNLIQHITENQNNYDALIFFTYLYYPTVRGLNIAPEKSILVPTAHDEPLIYLDIFKALFKLPEAILYNTASEKRFVNRLFNNCNIYSNIVGLGVEAVTNGTSKNTEAFIKDGNPYLVYVGRVDPAKGCQVLFSHFLAYRKATRSLLKLVVIGEVFMEVPKDESIILTGFIDESSKTSLLLKAKALVMPSFYESLSLVTLESMANGIPVIANKDCEVLKEHIENSQAGFLFNDYKSFEIAVNIINSPQFDADTLSANGKRYIAENYTWDVTIKKYQKAIAQINPR